MSSNKEKHKFPFLANICYLVNEKNQVLLQEKARGFGKGKWNGPGGKVRTGESWEDSVKREIKEETDLEVLKMEKIAELEFIFTQDENNNNLCYAYIIKEFSGEPRDMGEGKLQWFDFSTIPYEKMWDDDKYWLEEAIKGSFVHRRFYFDKEGNVFRHKNL